MAGRLDGKVAVITGGANGIGKSTAHRFVAEGARVVVADISEKSLARAADEFGSLGHAGVTHFARVDVSSESDVAALVATAIDTFGQIDVMFNNAGIGGPWDTALVDTKYEEWRRTFSINLDGVFFGIKHAAQAMKAQGRGGSIVNTASIAGLSGGGGPKVYSVTKAGVISLTQLAAVELASARIRVNAICPGAVLTGSPAWLTEERRQWHAHLQPLPASGAPEYIAAAALFLASDDAAFVTGEAMVVDGGLTAAGPRIPDRQPTDPLPY